MMLDCIVILFCSLTKGTTGLATWPLEMDRSVQSGRSRREVDAARLVGSIFLAFIFVWFHNLPQTVLGRRCSGGAIYTIPRGSAFKNAAKSLFSTKVS